MKKVKHAYQLTNKNCEFDRIVGHTYFELNKRSLDTLQDLLDNLQAAKDYLVVEINKLLER